MSNDVADLYQKLILEHNKAPRNFGKLAAANRTGEGNNPSCGDRFTVFAVVDDDKVSDISFHGSGCALSKASASLMTQALKGKTLDAARRLAATFEETVRTGKADDASLGELAVFSVVRRFPMRSKCALLPWQAFTAALASKT